MEFVARKNYGEIEVHVAYTNEYSDSTSAEISSPDFISSVLGVQSLFGIAYSELYRNSKNLKIARPYPRLKKELRVQGHVRVTREFAWRAAKLRFGNKRTLRELKPRHKGEASKQAS